MLPSHQFCWSLRHKINFKGIHWLSLLFMGYQLNLSPILLHLVPWQSLLLQWHHLVYENMVATPGHHDVSHCYITFDHHVAWFCLFLISFKEITSFLWYTLLCSSYHERKQERRKISQCRLIFIEIFHIHPSSSSSKRCLHCCSILCHPGWAACQVWMGTSHLPRYHIQQSTKMQ